MDMDINFSLETSTLIFYLLNSLALFIVASAISIPFDQIRHTNKNTPIICNNTPENDFSKYATQYYHHKGLKPCIDGWTRQLLFILKPWLYIEQC